MHIEERASTHVYRQKRMFTKEELEARESLCVHEQPAYCNAGCPLKLDAKAMVAAVAQGNFDRALSLYEKATPFPRLLSARCEAPCEAGCKLCTLGDGISLRALEAAAVSYGKNPVKRSLLRKKAKKIGLFGEDLFLLFLAGELARKMYPVTVFTRAASREEFLALCDPTGLARQDFAKLDIRLELGQVPSEALSARRDSFDVLCASAEVARVLDADADLDPALSYCRSLELVTAHPTGVLDAAFAAKKAALTVDRLAQKLDPGNTRGDEGAVPTRLYTDLTGVSGSRRIPCTSQEAAMAEARRCIQCHCDVCIRGCAYLQHYQKFPRVLTREIYNNVSIIMGDHMMNKPINACSLCGQCAVLCPNGFNMAEVCLLARENMVTTGKMPLAPHEFALMDQLFSNGEAFLCKPQPGVDACRYVFFPGCQATAIAPATIRAAYRDLCRRLSGGVALMLGCCGAISHWAGRYTMYDETVAFLKEHLEALGNPTVIAGCPSCKKTLESQGLTVRGIWEILETIGLPDTRTSWDRPIALHDACGARGDADTQSSIRRIAQALGCQLAQIPYSGDEAPCCGYGGLTQFTNRPLAKKMTEQVLERSDLPFLSYCMACRDRLAREGRESVHLLELVYGTAADHCPDISAKRFNRLGLRQQLLKELWNEEVEAMEPGFTIEYTPQAEVRMDERMILKSDVQRVLEQFRQTREAVLDGDTGLITARSRLGNVTFWVSFTETDTGCLVHSAYSHRMNIVNRR